MSANFPPVLPSAKGAPVLWDARQLISSFEDGNEHGWHEELQFLWFDDRERTMKLLDEVGNVGRIMEPVTVGHDRRVWDGHHRIAVALALSLPVPVVFAEEQEPSE
ncbi:ParB-like nuclease domain protein [Mycobacterium phage Moostard]|nr:ParB-like nuclease domain protein [Mycobacterium phage Samty]QDK03595.1 ParB-like nuclease domain protein [Mycobacterium phage Finnry]QZD99251.1 ParB-like nuclease domain protein [Mycobacterium phage Moostard]